MAEEDSTNPMTSIVSLSGGVGSAVAAERTLQRYGDRVKLWFSDVRHEDERDSRVRYIGDCRPVLCARCRGHRQTDAGANAA